MGSTDQRRNTLNPRPLWAAAIAGVSLVGLTSCLQNGSGDAQGALTARSARPVPGCVVRVNNGRSDFPFVDGYKAISAFNDYLEGHASISAKQAFVAGGKLSTGDANKLQGQNLQYLTGGRYELETIWQITWNGTYDEGSGQLRPRNMNTPPLEEAGPAARSLWVGNECWSDVVGERSKQDNCACQLLTVDEQQKEVDDERKHDLDTKDPILLQVLGANFSQDVQLDRGQWAKCGTPDFRQVTNSPKLRVWVEGDRDRTGFGATPSAYVWQHHRDRLNEVHFGDASQPMNGVVLNPDLEEADLAKLRIGFGPYHCEFSGSVGNKSTGLGQAADWFAKLRDWIDGSGDAVRVPYADGLNLRNCKFKDVEPACKATGIDESISCAPAEERSLPGLRSIRVALFRGDRAGATESRTALGLKSGQCIDVDGASGRQGGTSGETGDVLYGGYQAPRYTSPSGVHTTGVAGQPKYTTQIVVDSSVDYDAPSGTVGSTLPTIWLWPGLDGNATPSSFDDVSHVRMETCVKLETNINKSGLQVDDGAGITGFPVASFNRICAHGSKNAVRIHHSNGVALAMTWSTSLSATHPQMMNCALLHDKPQAALGKGLQYRALECRKSDSETVQLKLWAVLTTFDPS